MLSQHSSHWVAAAAVSVGCHCSTSSWWLCGLTTAWYVPLPLTASAFTTTVPISEPGTSYMMSCRTDSCSKLNYWKPNLIIVHLKENIREYYTMQYFKKVAFIVLFTISISSWFKKIPKIVLFIKYRNRTSTDRSDLAPVPLASALVAIAFRAQSVNCSSTWKLKNLWKNI